MRTHPACPARPGRQLVVMAADDVEALATALRNAIAKQGDRVKDVFKALDKDGDGSVSQKEFSDGILGLGLPLAKEQFAHIDGAPSPAHPPPNRRTATRAGCGRAMCPATHRHPLLPQVSSRCSTPTAPAASTTGS